MNAQEKIPVTREQILLSNIVERAIEVMEMLSYSIDGNFKITLEMDLIAIHMISSPLDFQGLYSANDIDFCHDILGVINNINRSTSQLENDFKLIFVLK